MFCEKILGAEWAVNLYVHGGAELTKTGPLVDGVEEGGSSEGDESGESQKLGEGSLGAMDDDELEAEIRRLEALNRHLMFLLSAFLPLTLAMHIKDAIS